MKKTFQQNGKSSISHVAMIDCTSIEDAVAKISAASLTAKLSIESADSYDGSGRSSHYTNKGHKSWVHTCSGGRTYGIHEINENEFVAFLIVNPNDSKDAMRLRSNGWEIANSQNLAVELCSMLNQVCEDNVFTTRHSLAKSLPVTTSKTALV